jgi:Arabinose-binding domain of AraC transcription regulator, N-term
VPAEDFVAARPQNLSSAPGLDTSSSRRPAYATVKARNVAAIPGVLREFGADVPAILQKAGLDPNFFDDLEQVMPYATLGRLLTESVKATGCESFGLRVGAKTKLSSLGLTSLVSLNSPTVRDALLVINDTLKTSETGGATYLEARDGLASFGYTVVAPNIEAADQIEDGSLAIAFNILRRVCGPSWRPILVRLARDPPRDRAPFSAVLRGAGRIRRAFDLSDLRRRDA